MLEGELEAAICRAFPLLLPDLYQAGYRIVSSQAVLLGRRLDLLLQTADERTCIIELKAGAPPMPDVRDQILDYADCWRTSYPKQTDLRLMVVSTVIPEKTASELGNFGVESRAISVAEVLDALERSQTDGRVPTGLKSMPNDLAKVRHLLSDYDAIKVPKGLVLAPPWSHEKVFLALVKRGERHKDLWKKNVYVQLCPQNPLCAVLYGPKVEVTKGMVHFNSRPSSWNEAFFQQVKPCLKYVRSDNKGPGKERSNFDWYSVGDWDSFATSLGL